MTISAASFFIVRNIVPLICLLFSLSSSSLAQTNDSSVYLSSSTKQANSLLIQRALSSTLDFDRLAHLSDYYGHRLSGSEELEQAIASIIASVASFSMQTPHTGVMYYEDGIPKFRMPLLL